MVCDPKKIFTDLDVVGTILSYSNLWISGGPKVIFSANTNTNLEIYNFKYKMNDYFNIFTFASSVLQTAEIHTGQYTTDGQTVDDTTLVERISFV